MLDGTLIATDRCRTTNPDTGHDLWYSGKHRAHGGNVQVLWDPEGFPVAVSDAQPGSMHDIAAARATGFLGAVHAAAAQRPQVRCPRDRIASGCRGRWR